VDVHCFQQDTQDEQLLTSSRGRIAALRHHDAVAFLFLKRLSFETP